MNNESQLLIKEATINSILRLVMNDQNSKNALSNKMISALMDAIAFANNDNSIKVIVIASKGNVYSAGHDLKEITQARKGPDNGESFFKELFRSCSVLMQAIVNSSKPVIAEVNGVATAAGCQLVASCDLAYSTKEALFATPGVNIGLFCSTPMVAVSRNLSRKKIMEMLLTGEKLSAKDAVDYGLINHCVPLDQLHQKTLSIANIIASKPLSTVKIGKEAFYKQVEMPIDEAYKYTSEVMAMNMMEKDAYEGISAFLDKRSPSWNE